MMNHLNSLTKPIALFLALLFLLVLLPVSFSSAQAGIAVDENGVLDLSGCTAEEVIPCIEQADKSKVLEVNLMDAEGKTQVGVDTIGQIAAALPDAHIRCSFELFGQTVSSEDERIEYDKVTIGNEGLAQIREVLPYLTGCTYLLLADCGIDNELLAQLREDFPEKHVVWRLHIFNGANSFLTDITLFRSTMIGDSDAELMKYCNEVKYIDVGHQTHLSDVSFLAYMPDLEACIIAITAVEDISPLKNCKKLEYLEIFNNTISDLSPLAELENLQHLNLANMCNLTDITPLYGLKNLKRLRIDTPYDLDKSRIPREQLDTIARLMPDCDMMFGPGGRVTNGWRVDCDYRWSSRYVLLREQMKYDEF